MPQGSCNSGIGRRIGQALDEGRQAWEQRTQLSEKRQQSHLKRWLLAGVVTALLVALVWSTLGLAAVAAPQRALAAQLQLTAASSSQGQAQLQNQLADLQSRCSSESPLGCSAQLQTEALIAWCRLDATQAELRAALEAKLEALQSPTAALEVLPGVQAITQTHSITCHAAAGASRPEASTQHQVWACESLCCCASKTVHTFLHVLRPCRLLLAGHSAVLPSGKLSLGRILWCKLAGLLPALLPHPQHPLAQQVLSSTGCVTCLCTPPLTSTCCSGADALNGRDAARLSALCWQQWTPVGGS